MVFRLFSSKKESLCHSILLLSIRRRCEFHSPGAYPISIGDPRIEIHSGAFVDFGFLLLRNKKILSNSSAFGRAKGLNEAGVHSDVSNS